MFAIMLAVTRSVNALKSTLTSGCPDNVSTVLLKLNSSILEDNNLNNVRHSRIYIFKIILDCSVSLFLSVFEICRV